MSASATKTWRALRLKRLKRGPSLGDEFDVPRTGKPLVRHAIRAGEQLFMVVLCVVSLLPFYAMIVNSLKSTAEYAESPGSLALPRHPTLIKYADAWTDLGFAAMTKNTIILAISAALVTTAIAALAGFALARLDVAGKRLYLLGCIALMSVPAVVVIVPLYELMVSIGWVNSYPSAIIAEIGLQTPLAVYLAYTYLADVPSDLFNAAAVDGASLTQQFVWIALPLIRPVLATISLVTGIFVWNDLLVPLIFWQDQRLRVLMVGLANLAPGRGAAFTDVPLIMAGVAISSIPVVVLFIAAQRFFVRGLTQGALK